MSAETVGTVDLGAGENPDPRADVTVDCVDLETVDIVHDLEDRPWPFDDDSVEHLVARHVFEHLEHPEDAFAEAGRVLVDGGTLEVRVPIGIDARTDPTHTMEWTWETPLYFDVDGPYDYGWELPFILADREVDVWYDGPQLVIPNAVYRRLHPRPSPDGAEDALLQRILGRHGPGKWLSSVPGLSGELTAIYRRMKR